MGRMRLTVIGCAGSFPGPDSPASCYLLEADGFRLVIDAVILSHLHADHCVDLSSFRIAREYVPGGPMRVIPVYAPAGGLERIAGVHGVDDEDGLASRFAFSTLAPGHLAV